MDQIDDSFVFVYILGYALIFALVAIPVFLAALFIGRRLRGNMNPPFKKVGDVFTFQDRGNQTTVAVELVPGTYKFQYQFPAGVSVKIDLISLGDGDSEILFIKSGAGSQTLRIDSRGRYAFQVEPAQERAEWSFKISPLGLPSQRE